MTGNSAADEAKSTGWSRGRVLKVAGLAAVAIGAVLLIQLLPLDAWKSRLEAYVEANGVWGGVVFGLVYVVAAVALLPASALTLVAGAVFGPLWGFVIVSIASTTAAACTLVIGRYLARDQVERWAGSSPRFAAVDRAIATGGWKVVAMLRLSPAIPFNLQNYMYGLTSIPLWKCVLTSWIAMMPGTFLYVYLGYLGGEAATGGGDDGSAQVGKWVLLGVGLLATIGVTVYLTKLAKRELAKQTEIT